MTVSRPLPLADGVLGPPFSLTDPEDHAASFLSRASTRFCRKGVFCVGRLAESRPSLPGALAMPSA